MFLRIFENKTNDLIFAEIKKNKYINFCFIYLMSKRKIQIAVPNLVFIIYYAIKFNNFGFDPLVVDILFKSFSLLNNLLDK